MFKNHTTTNHLLNDYLEGIKGYRGVIAKDQLIPPYKYKDSRYFIIINLDDFVDPETTRGGTHWTVLFRKDRSMPWEYFDSFGFEPPEEIIRFCKQNRNDGPDILLYNTSQIQDNKSTACGYFCLKYIFDRLKGMSQYDALYQYDLKDLKKNEKIIQQFINGL